MPQYSLIILVGLGGLFVLLGIVAIIWGNREKKKYYDSVATHADLREFIEQQPRRPEPEALKTGGWIAIAIGLLMLIMGGSFWLWG